MISLLREITLTPSVGDFPKHPKFLPEVVSVEFLGLFVLNSQSGRLLQAVVAARVTRRPQNFYLLVWKKYSNQALHNNRSIYALSP